MGLAFDSKGNLYIADRDNNRVRRVDPDGIITTVAGTGKRGYGGDGGSAVSAELCGPQDLAVDTHDNLYIADDCNGRVRLVSTKGQISTMAGNGHPPAPDGSVGDGSPAIDAELAGVDGLAFGPDGALYVATNPGLRIRRIAGDGTISTIAGTGKAGTPTVGASATDVPFVELYGLAFDAGGNLYVADGNVAIYRIDPAGTIRRFAGAP